MTVSTSRHSAFTTTALVKVGELTNRTLVLPVAVFFPTSRCNSRCLSCDWWTSTGADDLSLEEIATLAAGLSSLGTRLVLFSGGEPLLRADVFDAADHFRAHGIALHLQTSGVQLERLAEDIGRRFSKVIVSLDAADEGLYQRIRGVAALPAIERGVARLRRVAPGVAVTVRATVHRLNFREIPKLIEHAKAMAVDGISFLAADVSATAFKRRGENRAAPLALTPDEVAELRDVVEDAAVTYREEFTSGFIAESPDRLRRLPQYYAALAGYGPFPTPSCNAPYVSVVIEADGAVRPCFFQPPVGTVRREPLGVIVTRNLVGFRSTLDVGTNPVCARCVCSLKTGWRSAPWQ